MHAFTDYVVSVSPLSDASLSEFDNPLPSRPPLRLLVMERYSQLFSSNAVLEPEEVAAIREDIKVRTNTIDQMELELKVLDAGCGRDEEERQRVQLERAHVMAERDALGRLLSPLRGFPEDILSEIFTTVSRAEGNDLGSWVVNLCLVCRVWRNVAVGTPKLWSHVRLCGCYLARLDIDKLSRWFARSGGVARHLEMGYLDCGCEHGQQTDDRGLDSTLTHILSHGPSVHKLSLIHVSPTRLWTLARHMKETKSGHGDRPWDSLKELRVYVSSDIRQRQASISLLQLLRDLPSVLSFQLTGLWYARKQRLQQHYPKSNTMLENLTKLIFEDLDLFSALQLLRLSSRLQELIIDMGDYRYGHFEHAAPIPLPNLRALRLKFWPPGHVADLPLLLHTPALVQFAVSLSVGDDEQGSNVHADFGSDITPNDRVEMVNGLTTFLQQSKAPIQYLRLENFGISSHGLTRLLVSLPSVTHLMLDWVKVEKSIFQPAHSTDSQLLPRLESLHLAPMYEEFPLPEVCEFFVHRFGESLPLDCRTLKVLTFVLDRKRLRDFDTQPESELRKAVNKLRKLGVDVFVNRSQWG